ncbi:MAG: tetratricopeptide repeat protein [Candidatus Obscuribacterales bacterium]|nr:tetratricopeptide repeat protein [Candidatus Obscuribacterales bacterium]
MSDSRSTITGNYSSTVASEEFSPDGGISMLTTVASGSAVRDPEVESRIIRRLEELESAQANKELVIEVYNKLVRYYLRHDDLKKASETLERTLSFAKSAYGEKHPGVAPVLIELAFISYQQSKYEPAKSYLEPALEIQEKAYGRVSEQVAFVVHKLGRVNEALGDLAVAEELYLRSVTTYQNTYSEDDSQILIARNDLSRVRRKRK